MMNPVIEASQITVSFGSVTAVKGVSLSVGRGEVFGLLGPNGSGKTSLIRALCGLIPLTNGWARVLDRDVHRQADAIRVRIGYMSQKFGLYADLTAWENMLFYGGIYGLSRQQMQSRITELVGLCGLEPYLDRRASQLSGGWKQRLALVCALLHRPQLVFLDEPTAGIDPVARRALWDLLFQLAADGITFFVTTHYMDEAERCGRVGYMYLGRLLALGTPSELKSLPEITPPGTHRLEIIGPNPAALLVRLHRCEGVHEATLSGQSVHALIDCDRSPTSLGLDGCQVRPIEPSLEDVFVALASGLHPEATKKGGRSERLSGI